MIIKKILPAIFLLIFLVFVAKANGFHLRKSTHQTTTCPNCNVILISIDTLRADHLSLYGYPKKTTPNLDQISENARIFKNFYVNTPWTLPSHASMLASNYASNLKMQSIVDKFPPESTMIAQVLKDKGYETASIAYDTAAFVSQKHGYDKGFDDFDFIKPNPNEQDADVIFPKAIEWLDQNKNQKFFLFLHTFQVHDPYCPPKEYDTFKENYKGELNCVGPDTIAAVNRGELKLSEEDLKRYISLYDGEILFTDHYLGLLFEKLSELGMDKNTIVVITSDHGEEFGERSLWGIHSYSLYEELVHVPLIIKAPNLKPQTDQKLASMIDIPPTILDLLGLPVPPEFKGTSIRKTNQKPIYVETSANKQDLMHYDKAVATIGQIEPKVRQTQQIPNLKQAVVAYGWKLIVNNDSGDEELYNLQSDPKELTNLIGQNLPQETQLKTILKNFQNENSENQPTGDFLKDLEKSFGF